MKKKILLVEDELDTREAVQEFLINEGYEVITACDGEAAIACMKDQIFAMILLDIMLPKINGVVVLNWIRKQSDVPVIMLTAMSDEYTQMMSFDEQADDYITKPFSLVLLVKRMEAVFRRIHEQEAVELWHYNDAIVDFIGYQATLKGKIIDLKPKEFTLLKYLIEHKNHVLTREQILDQLWKNELPQDRVIDVYIKNLRKKLALDCIITVKGIGYKFEERL